MEHHVATFDRLNVGRALEVASEPLDAFFAAEGPVRKHARSLEDPYGVTEDEQPVREKRSDEPATA
jgi:hypothetical protein